MLPFPFSFTNTLDLFTDTVSLNSCTIAFKFDELCIFLVCTGLTLVINLGILLCIIVILRAFLMASFTWDGFISFSKLMYISGRLIKGRLFARLLVICKASVDRMCSSWWQDYAALRCHLRENLLLKVSARKSKTSATVTL